MSYLMPRLTTLSTKVDETSDLYRRFEEYREGKGETRSESMRQLIRAGLEAENRPPAPIRRARTALAIAVAVGGLLTIGIAIMGVAAAALGAPPLFRAIIASTFVGAGAPTGVAIIALAFDLDRTVVEYVMPHTGQEVKL